MKLLLGLGIAISPAALLFGIWLGMSLTHKDIERMREWCDKRAAREVRW